MDRQNTLTSKVSTFIEKNPLSLKVCGFGGLFCAAGTNISLIGIGNMWFIYYSGQSCSAGRPASGSLFVSPSFMLGKTFCPSDYTQNFHIF